MLYIYIHTGNYIETWPFTNPRVRIRKDVQLKYRLICEGSPDSQVGCGLGMRRTGMFTQPKQGTKTIKHGCLTPEHGDFMGLNQWFMDLEFVKNGFGSFWMCMDQMLQYFVFLTSCGVYWLQHFLGKWTRDLTRKLQTHQAVGTQEILHFLVGVSYENPTRFRWDVCCSC